VADRLGGVDILVNCDADYTPFRLDEASDAQIMNMIPQTLTAPVFCMREAIGWMRRRGGGDIVNISSQSAEQPQPFMGLYSAAKAGIETISQNLRWELKGENFRILVCQIGVIAETVAQLDGDLGERVAASWAKTGIGPMYAFPGSKAETIAAAIAHAVDAPRDTHFQTLRLRGMDPLDG
jgi:NAD(P)-dependent dehydrogenase (short-subunit alcohol dehydrogenase family)